MQPTSKETQQLAPYIIATEEVRTDTRFNLGDSVFLEAHYHTAASIRSISYWRGKIRNRMNPLQTFAPPYQITFDPQAEEYSKGLLLFEVPQARSPISSEGRYSCHWNDEQLFSSKQELADYLLKWLRIPNQRPQTTPTPKEKAPARILEHKIKDRLEKLSSAIVKDDTPEAATYFSKLPSIEPRDWVYIVVEDENKLPKLFKVPLEGYQITRWYEQGCTCERTQYCFVNPLNQQTEVVDQLGQKLFLHKEEAIRYATQLIQQKLGLL